MADELPDWMCEYRETPDVNQRYSLLRDELTQLRGEAGRDDWFDRDEVRDTVQTLADELPGDLIVFAANDFGLPVGYRPAGSDRELQDEIRQELLKGKYESHDDLNELRRRLLEAHPEIHKAILCEYLGGELRYHLPEGSSQETNFLTVREMVGLIDWTTNSLQAPGMSLEY